MRAPPTFGKANILENVFFLYNEAYRSHCRFELTLRRKTVFPV